MDILNLSIKKYKGQYCYVITNYEEGKKENIKVLYDNDLSIEKNQAILKGLNKLKFITELMIKCYKDNIKI